MKSRKQSLILIAETEMRFWVRIMNALRRDIYPYDGVLIDIHRMNREAQLTWLPSAWEALHRCARFYRANWSIYNKKSGHRPADPMQYAQQCYNEAHECLVVLTTNKINM